MSGEGKIKLEAALVLAAKEAHIDHLKQELKTCANELCLRCGQYKKEHLGACNDCRWRKARHGEIE